MILARLFFDIGNERFRSPPSGAPRVSDSARSCQPLVPGFFPLLILSTAWPCLAVLRQLRAGSTSPEPRIMEQMQMQAAIGGSSSSARGIKIKRSRTPSPARRDLEGEEERDGSREVTPELDEVCYIITYGCQSPSHASSTTSRLGPMLSGSSITQDWSVGANMSCSTANLRINTIPMPFRYVTSVSIDLY